MVEKPFRGWASQLSLLAVVLLCAVLRISVLVCGWSLCSRFFVLVCGWSLLPVGCCCCCPLGSWGAPKLSWVDDGPPRFFCPEDAPPVMAAGTCKRADQGGGNHSSSETCKSRPPFFGPLGKPMPFPIYREPWGSRCLSQSPQTALGQPMPFPAFSQSEPGEPFGRNPALGSM